MLLSGKIPRVASNQPSEHGRWRIGRAGYASSGTKTASEGEIIRLVRSEENEKKGAADCRSLRVGKP
jgi:hypothetical protein